MSLRAASRISASYFFPSLYFFLSFPSRYLVRFSSCNFTDTGSVKNHSSVPPFIDTSRREEKSLSQLETDTAHPTPHFSFVAA